MSKKNLGDWKLPISHRPSVTLECSAGVGYVRWTNAKGNGSEYLSTLLSCFDEQGVLQPNLIAELVYVATEMAKAIASDKSPAAAQAARDQATLNLPNLASNAAPTATGWDFEKGIAHFFDLGATASASQKADERRAVAHLVEYVRRECHIRLWPELDWLKIQKALRAWCENVKRQFEQQLATGSKGSHSGAVALKENATRSGLPELRTAIRATQVLVRIAEWLGEHEPESGAVRPRVKKVGQAVETIWHTAFKRNAPSEQPRHTPVEYAKIVTALIDRSVQIDPRLRLALLMNMERRAGQVLFVRRSAVKMKDNVPFTFDIPAKGTKRTPDICGFIPAAAEALSAALQDGYLAEFEAAYKEQRIRDYWLFPVGKLSKGRARFAVHKITGDPWNERSLHEEFKKLETLCGIESIEGRGHYGLKRVATDIVDALEDDEELKNRLFSHATAEQRHAYMKLLPRKLRMAQQELELQTKIREAAIAFQTDMADMAEADPGRES